jgi:gliding motility-associated-like protein
MFRYPIRRNFGLSSILLTCLIYTPSLLGQTNQTGAYTVYGSANRNSCNCFILTPAEKDQAGAVWSTNAIDLQRSFDLQFKVNLGCRGGDVGADGIAFVLQPTDTGLGKNAKDLGFKGINHSLGVTIDTYQNTDYGDPVYDHLAFQANGDVNHEHLANNLAGPVQALENSPSIKDCNWHILEVKWDPSDSTLSAFMDGVYRLSMQKDIIHRLFFGISKVHWGLTGGTGGAFNEQQVCTVIQANPYVDPAQKFCENAPITFRDSSTNQVFMNHWYWNFGDGVSSHAQDPSHLYTKPGNYLVKEAVQDAAGCSDTNTTHVDIGSYPVAKFSAGSVCSGMPVSVTNQSTNTLGNINTWKWTLSNGIVSTDSIPSLGVLAPGNYSLALSATSVENCTSLTPYDTSFSIYPKPEIGFNADTVCVGTPITLKAMTKSALPISRWYWQVDTLILDSGRIFQHTFNEETTFQALLWAFSNQGCASDTAQQTIQVQQSHAFAGNDTVAAKGYPMQLQASGGLTYRWFPLTFLSDPDISDPVAQPTDSITYTVTAFSSAGCPSSATINVKVYRGPTFYVPSAFTPNGDGINDLLKVVAVGIRQFEFLKVYDRWGKLMYNSADLETGWDGTENGHPMPAGAYIWFVQGIDLEGKVLDQKGTSVLMR